MEGESQLIYPKEIASLQFVLYRDTYRDLGDPLRYEQIRKNEDFSHLTDKQFDYMLKESIEVGIVERFEGNYYGLTADTYNTINASLEKAAKENNQDINLPRIIEMDPEELEEMIGSNRIRDIEIIE